MADARTGGLLAWSRSKLETVPLTAVQRERENRISNTAHPSARSNLIAVASRTLDRDASAALSVNSMCSQQGITKDFIIISDLKTSWLLPSSTVALSTCKYGCRTARLPYCPQPYGRITSFLDLVMAKIIDPSLVDIVIIGAVPDRWRRYSVIRRALNGYMTGWRKALLADVPVSLSLRGLPTEQKARYARTTCTDAYHRRIDDGTNGR